LGLAGDLLTTWLPPSSSGWPAQLASMSTANLWDAARFARGVLRAGGPLGWFATLQLVALVAIGLVYWGWLATWLARRQRRWL
jgi:hypothetical protein